MLVTFASLILYKFCSIPALYTKISDFYANASSLYAGIPTLNADICLFGFHYAGNLHGWVLVCHLQSVSNDGARAMRRKGGEGGDSTLAVKTYAQVYARNYYGALFIVPSRGQIPNPNLATGPAGE